MCINTQRQILEWVAPPSKQRNRELPEALPDHLAGSERSRSNLWDPLFDILYADTDCVGVDVSATQASLDVLGTRGGFLRAS